MTSKGRLSVSIDQALIDAAHASVVAGRAPSISAWVNDALARQVAHDRRIIALADFVSEYETAHGEITDAEIAEATRNARSRAVVVRARPRSQTNTRARRGESA